MNNCFNGNNPLFIKRCFLGALLLCFYAAQSQLQAQSDNKIDHSKATIAESIEYCSDPNTFTNCWQEIQKSKASAPGGPQNTLELLMLFFESSKQALADSIFLTKYFSHLKEAFDLLQELKPEHPQISTLRLNLAAYYTRLGLPDKAIEQYEIIIGAFPGNTRYGSEALFFSAQLLYEKGHYSPALERYLKIQSIVFLPLTTEEWNKRLAECRFRIMEQSAHVSDFSAAEKQFEKILSSNIAGDFRDSILFHYAELNMFQGDTLKACQTLLEVIGKDPNHPIKISSIYNLFLFRCPELKNNHSQIPPYIWHGTKFLTSEQTHERKLFVLFQIAEYILNFQDPSALNELLMSPYLAELSQSEIRDLLILFYRNAEKQNLQTALLSWTESNALTKVKKDTNLSAVTTLYREYYQLNKDEGFQIHNIPPQEYKWEKQLHLFLKGAWHARLSNSSEENALLSLDSVQYYFTLLGKGNSEWAFSGAQELARYYRWIIQKMNSESLEPSGKPYRRIGHAMIQIKFSYKINKLSKKIEQWKAHLANVPLEAKHRDLALPTIEKDQTKKYWENISKSLLEISHTLKGSEVAYEILIDKLQLLYSLDKKFQQSSTIAMLMGLLVWHQAEPAEINKAKTFDHQAFALHKLFEMFTRLEGVSDTVFLASLGELFQASLNSAPDKAPDKTTRDCFYYTQPSGEITCMPLASKLPTPQKVYQHFYNPTRRNEGAEYQKNRRRGYLAQYRILCEEQKIRNLKTELMNL